jgi:hypothetical protein
MEITAKVCTFCFIANSIQITAKIPCFVEMKSKQQHKICGVSK